MKKKQLIILIPILLALLVGGIFLIRALQKDSAPSPQQTGLPSATRPQALDSQTTEPQPSGPRDPNSDPANPQPETSQDGTQGPTGTQGTDPNQNDPQQTDPQSTVTQQTEPPATDPQQTTPQATESQATEPGSSGPEATKPNETTPTKPEPTEPKPTTPRPSTPTQSEPSEPENLPLTFPYAVPNQDIVIFGVSSYDGLFLEDGKSSSVSGISSVLVKNTGASDLELMSITMNRDGEPLTFIASDIPAGALIFVQERTGAKYEDGDYTDCEVIVTDGTTLGLALDEIRVVDNQDGSVTITNLTDRDFSDVRIFYKFYMADEDVYVGGITFTVRIQNLKAHDDITVKPSHYQAGGIKVVMVRTYE